MWCAEEEKRSVDRKDPVKSTYVSRSGTAGQMNALEAELHKRGFVLVADDAPKKKLVLKQYRRWQVEGKGGGNNPDCQSKTMPGNDFFSIDGSAICSNRIFAIVFSGNFK